MVRRKERSQRTTICECDIASLFVLCVVILGTLATSRAEQGKTKTSPAVATPVTPFESTPSLVVGRVVDERGNPVPGATLQSEVDKRVAAVKVSDTGQFQVNVDRSHWGQFLYLRGTNATGKQLGIATAYLSGERAPAVQVVLRPAQELRVVVANQRGELVKGATVLALGEGLLQLDSQITDERGHALLRFARDGSVAAVSATLPGSGFDYVRIQSPRILANQFMLPANSAEIKLTLAEVRSLRVRVVDYRDQPLAGVAIRPWEYLMLRKGGPVWLREQFEEVTDREGWVQFSTIPREHLGEMSFGGRMPADDMDKQARLEVWRSYVDAKTKAMTFKVPQHVVLRGSVKLADGSPAAGAYVAVSGAGPRDTDYRLHRGADMPPTPAGTVLAEEQVEVNRSAVTGADGTFSIRVPADKYYLLSASSDKLAAPQVSHAARGDREVPPLNFVLRPATRIFGTVQILTKPWRGGRVMLRQVAETDYYDLPAKDRLPPAKEFPVQWGRRVMSPVLMRSADIDQSGKFELHVGPGEYSLRGPPGFEPREIEIKAQRELEVNIHSDTPVQIPTTGSVVLAGDRSRKVPGARVIGAAKPPASQGFLQTTDQAGNFSCIRRTESLIVQASTADGLLAGVVEVEATANEIVVPVQPTATVHGRLLDRQTGQPLAHHSIQGIVLLGARPGPIFGAFENLTTTNALGEFTMIGLTVGMKYELSAVQRNRTGGFMGGRPLGFFQAKEAGTTRLADFKCGKVGPLDGAQDRMRTMMPLAPLAMRRKDAKLAEARALDQRVLLVVASQNGQAGRRFIEMYLGLSADPAFVRRELSNFALLALDTSDAPARTAAEKVLDSLDLLELNLPEEDDLLCVVLDQNGRKIAVTRAGELSSEGRLNGPKLFTFLRKNSLPVVDANDALTIALDQAKREQKQVLVQYRDLGSAPGVLLSRFCDRNRQVLEKDFVLVRINDRSPNGGALVRRLREKEDDATPWTAVVAESGKVVVSSESAEGNVGFPISDSEIEVFRKIISGGVQRTTPAEIEELIKDLQKLER